MDGTPSRKEVVQMKRSKPEPKGQSKVVRLLLMESNKVKGWTPPPLDIVLLDEDEENFYGYPVGYDDIQRRLTFGAAKIGTYRKKPNKTDPSYWVITWRKAMQDQKV